jgi:precorrin-2 dehydrogenase/sirohydrochlorin ferrochelatase
MPDLPVMLRVTGKKAVVIGGGTVARRRTAALVECGAHVTVIAPDVDDGIEGVQVERRAYREGDLRDAFLVVVATDDGEVNASVRREAVRGGVLINSTDGPERGDFSVMAHDRRGPLTVGVATDGISAKAAATIRDELLVELDRDWATLLETVTAYRDQLQLGVKDVAKRRAALMKLADEESVAVLKERGVAGLKERCEWIVREATQL